MAKNEDKKAEDKSEGQIRASVARSVGDTAVVGRTDGPGADGPRTAEEKKKAAEEKKEYTLIADAIVDGKEVFAGDTIKLTEAGRRYMKSKFYIR